MEIKRFTDYYSRSIRIIFLILVALGIGINLLDISNFAHEEKYILYINIPTSILLLIIAIAHIGFKVPLATCFISGIYLIVANILISDHLAIRTPESELLTLFRETIFFILMLVFAGIFVRRFHAIMVFGIITAKYLYIAINLKHTFLLEHLPIFMLTFAAITAVVYFFAGVLHKSTIEIQQKQKTITDTNEELKTNAEELRATTEDLKSKNEALQDLNVSKDKFFTIISHDLKNPINTLNGFVELLVTKGDKLSIDKRKLYLTHIQAAVNNIINLLDSLLEWSRSKRNKTKVEPSTLKITDLVDSVFDYMKTQAADKKIELVNLTQSGHVVFADYNMVFTILRNLVSNAIKYSYPSKMTSVVSEKRDDVIVVRVMDEGIGITDDIMEKLRRMSEPVSTPGTHDEVGTGLGLLLCNEYARKNNGTFDFSTSKDDGSSFWFTLPVPLKKPSK